MEADETGTIARLGGHPHQLTDPAIARHHGRIVKLMGDGALVAFDSLVDAVTCAAEIRKAVAVHETIVGSSALVSTKVRYPGAKRVWEGPFSVTACS